MALKLSDLSWAKKYAWAPDCQYRNGKYYFYYPTDQDFIGVAVADKPEGPFIDPLNKPLITRQTKGVVNNRDLIDPCIFIDDDNTPYLLFGQNTVNIVKLNDDMITLADTVKTLTGTNHFFEAVWMHKYKGTYYISYSGKGEILYATSKNIFGPYRYKGSILGPVSSGTNHHSIVQFKKNWYLFYHTADLSISRTDGSKEQKHLAQFRRSTCIEHLYYDKNGNILPVSPTKEGVTLKRK